MLTRGVQVTFCMDVGDRHPCGATPLASAQAAAAAFLHDNWPFGPPLPEFFFDPRPPSGGVSSSCTPSASWWTHARP